MNEGNRAIDVAIAALTLFAGMPAQADAIVGAWCSEKGRRFAIEDSSVTTTRGTRLSGTYTRHTFNFSLPAEEADAGAAVDMLLQGETQVRLTIGAAGVKPWRQCPPGISS